MVRTPSLCLPQRRITIHHHLCPLPLYSASYLLLVHQLQDQKRESIINHMIDSLIGVIENTLMNQTTPWLLMLLLLLLLLPSLSQAATTVTIINLSLKIHSISFTHNQQRNMERRETHPNPICLPLKQQQPPQQQQQQRPLQHYPLILICCSPQIIKTITTRIMAVLIPPLHTPRLHPLRLQLLLLQLPWLLSTQINLRPPPCRVSPPHVLPWTKLPLTLSITVRRLCYQRKMKPQCQKQRQHLHL